MMFRTLLSPVDGSPFSENSLPFALNIAARACAALHVALVHVPHTIGESSAAHWADLDVEARNDESKYLAGLRRRLCEASRANIEIHHSEGIIPETLAGEVIQRNIDLVVINAHGWGYISRAVVGSVSDYLMRHLHVPLLVVHTLPEARPDLSRPISIRRVLIPLDGSPMAEGILPAARALGELWQAEYTLLRVVSPPRSYWGSWGEEQPSSQHPLLGALQDDASTYLETLARQFRGDSLAVDTRVVVGTNPAAAILEETRASECDVIAIATHGRGGLSRLLWTSVADKVIRGAHTPVLVCNTS